MKILSLNTYPDDSVGGGTEKTRETLMTAFWKAGHEVVGVATSAEGMTEAHEFRGIRRWRVRIWNLYWPGKNVTRPGWKRGVWHLLDLYNWPMKHRLGKILDAEKPDAVILHNLPGWSVAAISAVHDRGIPMIQILHDHYNICVNSAMFWDGKDCKTQCKDCRIMRFIHRRITNKVDAVVGVSKYILDRHLAHGAFSNVKVKTVIHNVRSAAALGLAEAPALRAKSATGRGDIEIRFGFIGSLIENKGIEYLLKSFETFGNSRAELWVAGRGKPDYEAKLKARYAAPNVRFLGQMMPKDFFTAVDVTVVPSLWQENFPGVVSESLAFGVPVIGSRRGGIPEMIDHGRTGWIFDPDEPGSLETLLHNCFDNLNDIGRMGAIAEHESPRFLSTKSWQLAYQEILEKLVRNNGSQ